MCYSAMIRQNIKQLNYKFSARIDLNLFEILFRDRAAGSGAKISRELEQSFLENPSTEQEKTIAQLIVNWRATDLARTEQELFIQQKRLETAQAQLAQKQTKTLQKEIRIAGDKVQKLKSKLEQISGAVSDQARIFPMSIAPLIVMEGNQKWIRPFRYHLRPASEGPEFDRKFDGTYNIRRDSLNRVFWWKNLFGKNHAVMVMTAFFENVKIHDYEHRELKPGETPKNTIIEFKPQVQHDLLIPCLFDHNQEGSFRLDSFGLITDEPNPEVLEAGHDRTPIVLKSESLNLWLNTQNPQQIDFDELLANKERNIFDHRIDFPLRA